MYGYKLKKPVGLPRAVWGCKTSVDSYSWVNKNKPNMIEFSLCRADKRKLCFSGTGEIELIERSFSCLVGDSQVSSFADEGVTVEISSIALSFDTLEYEAKSFEESDFYDTDCILISHVAEGLSDGEYCELERLLHRFIHCYMNKCAASELECAAITFELLSKIDSVTRRNNNAKKDKYIN